MPLSRKSWGKEIKMSVPQVSLQGKPAQVHQTKGGQRSWAAFYSPARLELPKESLSEKSLVSQNYKSETVNVDSEN